MLVGLGTRQIFLKVCYGPMQYDEIGQPKLRQHSVKTILIVLGSNNTASLAMMVAIFILHDGLDFRSGV